MTPARKITRPTGKPVTAIMPTGGSRVDARPRSPEGLPYDPPTVPARKSTVGGKAHVTECISAEGPTLAMLHAQKRAEALAGVA